jgi:hypothetical protein
MPDYQLTDQPENTFQSVYKPIKFSARAETTNRDAYVSSKVTITPYDNITDAELTDQKVSIRVQPSINIPNHNSAGNTPNNIYLYYSIDVSSICRDFLSYNLRPCTHDLSTMVRRDITLAEISNNVYQKFEVEFELEVISSGELTLSGESDSGTFVATNTALLHEQEHYLNIAKNLYDGSTSQEQGADLLYQYVHSGDADYQKNRQKYLTTKPVSNRIIGTDECEYLSFLHKDDTTNDVRVLVRFYDFNNNVIGTDVAGTDNTYALIITKTVDGNGNTGSHLNSWADSGSTDETHSVCQVGIGTRNIKESIRNRFNDSCAVTDFTNIKYYEVYTEYSGSDKIGETVRYYIDHTRQRVDGVRFHWQNRLGGIDSYTFDGTFSEGINISSKSYEQSIYPDFRGQLGDSAINTNVNVGDNPLYAEDYGALVPRVAGLTDDKYPSVRKSQVKAVKEGSAVSRPYGVGEQDMFEDLLASPNVWIEKGWVGKEIFRESFDYANFAAYNTDWYASGGGSGDVSFSTTDGQLSGTKTIVIGNDSGNDELFSYHRKAIPYNPKSIYEIEIRMKSSGTSNGTHYCGFVGLAADGTTLISSIGTEALSPAHYVTLSSYDQTADDRWETFRGYVSGNSDSYTPNAHDPNNPSTAYTGVRYIKPMFLVNYNDQSDITQIDYIVVREYQTDIPNSNGWYSTLNRNYYVPVVIKDASVTTFDNENLQRCTVNYIESKAKRTIQ